MGENRVAKKILWSTIIYGGLVGCLGVSGCLVILEKKVLVGEASYSFKSVQIYLGILTAVITGSFLSRMAVKGLIEDKSGNIGLIGFKKGARYGTLTGAITGLVIGIIGWINSGNLNNSDIWNTFLICSMFGVVSGLFFGLIVGIVAGPLLGFIINFILKK